ncbi:hypothetical protein ACJX0J_005428, partial [Zea mays]
FISKCLLPDLSNICLYFMLAKLSLLNMTSNLHVTLADIPYIFLVGDNFSTKKRLRQRDHHLQFFSIFYSVLTTFDLGFFGKANPIRGNIGFMWLFKLINEDGIALVGHDLIKKFTTLLNRIDMIIKKFCVSPPRTRKLIITCMSFLVMIVLMGGLFLFLWQIVAGLLFSHKNVGIRFQGIFSRLLCFFLFMYASSTIHIVFGICCNLRRGNLFD